MNAKQIQTNEQSASDLNLSLIALEKAEQPSLWSRIKKALAPSDMTLESWERLEMKRSQASFTTNQGRNF